MKLTRRECLTGMAIMGLAGCGGGSGGPSVSPPAAGSTPTLSPTPIPSGSASTSSFTPESFGAAGDGNANDTDAFAKMTAAVNAAGGGTVVLSAKTYIVGAQTSDPTGFYLYAPASIMDFVGCTKALTILGNGARIKCADGLRYGTFDPKTGLPVQHTMPYLGTGDIASPYTAMISVKDCTAKVTIEHLELDGNLAGLSIGGPRGDTGWQLPACGLSLLNNVGGESITDVHSHHHGQDGIYMDGPADRTTSTALANIVSEYNGRQGCSIVGGCNYGFTDSHFNHTGRGGLTSAPGAGVDIEAETRSIRNVSFSGCEFANNSGAGVTADSGDTEGAIFTNCTFIGTTTWSVWPGKPRFKFTGCKFIGSICHGFADTDPNRATQFSSCSFLDDSSLSPTGQVFAQAIADLGGGDTNISFDSCQFMLKNDAVLPWTLTAKYNNCTMSQAAARQAYPRGVFTGVCRIDGNVDLYSSRVVGQLTVNGQIVPPTDFVG
jgi:hypothetical protein